MADEFDEEFSSDGEEVDEAPQPARAKAVRGLGDKAYERDSVKLVNREQKDQRAWKMVYIKKTIKDSNKLLDLVLAMIKKETKTKPEDRLRRTVKYLKELPWKDLPKFLEFLTEFDQSEWI